MLPGTVLSPTPTPDSLFDPEAGWWERAYEFGILNIPNPAYTNAAHKNGVQSLGCIFFPRQEHTDDLIFRDETGRFPPPRTSWLKSPNGTALTVTSSTQKKPFPPTLCRNMRNSAAR